MWSYGIDVSNWQGVINWDAVNADPEVAFVYMNVADGMWRGRPSGAPLSIADAFAMNVRYCRKPCGPYYFARPGSTDPIEAANFAFQHAGHMTMPHCLDMEDTGGLSLDQLVHWTGTWLGRMYSLDGRDSILYNGAFFSGPGLARYFPRNFWWLPAYTANSTINPDPLTMRSPALNGNREPDMWQYTSHGRIAGIGGNVDRNLVLTNKLLGLIEVKDMDLDGIAGLIKQMTGSALYHVNPHESERIKYLASIGAIGEVTEDTVPDLCFQVFPDMTMVQRTGDEAAKLRYLGVPDYGFRDDNWFGLLRLGSRDVA